MLQEILNALKAKFEGVSDAVLNRIATKLAKTVTTAEQVKSAVDGVTLQQVIDSYADNRATEATQTAIRNYEQKHGLKDGVKIDNQGDSKKKDPNQQSGGGTGEQTPEWAKAILKANEALTERIAKMEGANTTSARKAQITEIVSKLPETLRKPYERIALDKMTDDEFSSLVTSVTSEVDGIAKEISAKGAVFGRPNAQSRRENNEELTKEQLAAISHREGVSNADSQPF